MKIVIKQEIDVVDLWEAVWGSDGAGMIYWCDMIRKTNGKDINLWIKNDKGFYVANPQAMKIHDSIESKWHRVTVRDLAKGYKLAREARQTHCGHFELDIDDPDACFGDMVIQYAIFGKLVYG